MEKQAKGRRASETAQKAIAKHGKSLEAYEAMCARIGVPPGDVALAWLLSNPVVTAPIVGPRTQAQLDDAVRAIDVKLDADVTRELESIFPGPGGAAPEAYAW
jgi:aryl-alcohol dehydrogenase-like predicted oxidoreductase